MKCHISIITKVIINVRSGEMDFFRNRYHRINVILLTSVGQWPYQSKKWQKFQQIIFHVNILSVVIVQATRMFEMRKNVDIVIECFTPMGVQLVACCKSINCMVNRHKMKELLERMKRDWSSLTNDNEIKILQKYAEEGKNMAFAYAIFVFLSLMMYLVIPAMPKILDIILPLNESRQQTYLYETKYYYIDRENYYFTVVLHTYSGTIMTIATVAAVDTMHAAYVQHICGILAIVGYRLEKIADNVSLTFDAKPPIEDDVQYQKLKECIKMHRNALKFATLIESSYTTAFLIQLGLSMLLISVSLLQLLTKFGRYEEMYRLIQFISAQMFHLFFNSWPGQKLMNQSASFSNSVYAAGWYTFSLRTRSLLKILMLSATKSLKITANKLYDMSMENFGQVVQTSISYFTVLASLR